MVMRGLVVIGDLLGYRLPAGFQRLDVLDDREHGFVSRGHGSVYTKTYRFVKSINYRHMRTHKRAACCSDATNVDFSLNGQIH